MVAAVFSHPLVWQYVIALVIATGGVALAGRADGGREMARIFPAFWAWNKEHRSYTNVVTIVRFARERPWMWIVPLYAAAPSIAALIVAAGSSGNADLGHLVDRLAPWSDGLATSALVTYAVILVVHIAGSAWFLHVQLAEQAKGMQAMASGITEGRSRASVLGWMTVGLFLDEGGSLEELGWRGYVVPLLLASTGNRLGTSLFFAVLWWAWHLPREVPALLSPKRNLKQFARSQTVFLVSCAAIAIACTEVTIRTGSVWPAVMVHASGNVWNKAVGDGVYTRYKTDVRTWIGCAIAVVVAVSWLFT